MIENTSQFHLLDNSVPESLVFIDSQIPQYQHLVQGVIPKAKVIVLDSEKDGVAQITEVLAQYSNLSSVHIVSHGSPGCLYLGNSQLSLNTLHGYSRELQTWFTNSSIPQLLLYGCNVVAGDAGEEFISKLKILTGAEISASANPTGNKALGGNWELEVSTGNAAVSLAFSEDAKLSYGGILAVELDFLEAESIATPAGTVFFNVTTSPDGKYVYSVSNNGQVAIFERNSNANDPLSLKLTQDLSTILSFNFVPNGNLAISPSGNNAYITGFDQFGSTGVVALTRNPNSGTLGRVGATLIAFGATPSGIAVNNKYVYVVGGNTVQVFERDGAGALNPLTSFVSPIPGTSFTDVVLSPTDNHIYASDFTGAVQAFQYDRGPNRLTTIDIVSSTQQGLASIASANKITISPKGEHIYVTGNGNTVTALQRDPNSGKLTLVDSETDNGSSIDGLDGVGDVTVSSDGKNVYVAGASEGKVAVFERNTQDGSLQFIEFEEQGNNNVDGLNSPVGIAVSPNDGNGDYVYVVDGTFGNSKIAVFNRTNQSTVSIQASDNNASEINLDTGTFKIEREDGDTSKELTVNYTVGGTATNGTDYNQINNSVTIAAGDSFAEINITPKADSNSSEGNETVVVTLSESAEYALDSNKEATVTIADDTGNNTNPPSTNKDGIFDVPGTGGNPVNLKFTLFGRDTDNVNEVAIFRVENADGKIKGLSPGSPGYIDEALKQADVILSAPNNKTTNFFAGAERIIEGFQEGEDFGLLLVNNGSVDSVLAEETSKADVLLASTSGQIKITNLAGGKKQIQWKDKANDDGVYNDLVLRFETTDQDPANGNTKQGKEEIIDLTEFANDTRLQLSFIAVGDSLFDNKVGLYKIQDANGTVIDSSGNRLSPRDNGYKEAALANAITTTLDESSGDLVNLTRDDSNSLLAPYLIAGDKDYREKQGQTNVENTVLFTFEEANPEDFGGVKLGSRDFTRLWGDNIFGFEDMVDPSKTDHDFNDFVFKVQVDALAA